MNLAPNPQLSGEIVSVADGMRGVEQTLAKMRQIVKKGRVSLPIRQAATQIVFLTPEKDQFSEGEAIFNFVRDSIRYVRDIHQVETLQSAEITLATKMGDCDDQTTLLASMLEAIGYPTRFVVAGYHDPRMVEHVYLQAYLGNHWVDMDATEQHQMGWFPPDALAMAYERV